LLDYLLHKCVPFVLHLQTFNLLLPPLTSDDGSKKLKQCRDTITLKWLASIENKTQTIKEQ